MRIIVNDFAASTGGATSILVSFYNYLVSSGDCNEWYFLLSDKYIEETENIHVVLLDKEKKSRIRRLLFDYVYGRRLISKLKPDAVFYLQNTFIHGVHVPQIAYMDQPIPFQTACNFSFFDLEQRPYAIYQHIIGYLVKNACKAADLIIVQTEWMREAIVEQCRISVSKIKKIPPDIYGVCNKEKGSLDNHKFFYPASLTYYKNHGCIVQAIECINKTKKLDIQVDFTIETNEKMNFPYDEINCIGNISHSEVMDRYSTETLIFPSYIETYGLPLAEARLSGGMILTADTPFAHEILEGYVNAYYFDPFQPEQLAELIEDVYYGRIVKSDVSHEIETACKNSGWKEVVKCIQDAIPS